MLVLQRYPWQSIKVDDGVVVSILSSYQCSSRIGIEAPSGINIIREKLSDHPIEQKRVPESRNWGENIHSFEFKGLIQL